MKTISSILFFCLISISIFAQKKMKKEDAELIIQVDSIKGGLAHGWGNIFTAHVTKITKGIFNEKEIILTISAGEGEAVNFFYSIKSKDILELGFKKIEKDTEYFTGTGHYGNKKEKWKLIYYKKVE